MEDLSEKFHQINVEKTELINYLQEINDGGQVGYEIEIIHQIQLTEDKIRRKITDINNYIEKYESIIEKRIKLCNYLNQGLQFRELINKFMIIEL